MLQSSQWTNNLISIALFTIIKDALHNMIDSQTKTIKYRKQTGAHQRWLHIKVVFNRCVFRGILKVGGDVESQMSLDSRLDWSQY